MAHPLAGRKQSPEHIRRRVEATRAAKEQWTEERKALFREQVSNNSKSGTPEAMAKNSEAHRGKTTWNKGVPCSDEQKLKQSQTMRGKPSPLKGTKRGSQSPEYVQKRVDARNGYRHSEETKRRIRESNCKTWSKPEIRQKVTGENSPSWQGGISFEPYPVGWNNELRSAIRRRDGWQCQLCGCKDKPLDVHHVDYNKSNLDPENLVSLCHPCHMLTNYKRRSWMAFFGGKT